MKNNFLLVLNQIVTPIQELTCNLLPTKCRFDTLEGREHIVVPMVILTEGVHAGSRGPCYYPPDELSKTPASWDHKPIVVYHPELNGQGISACNPAVINNRKVGLMLNTKFEKGQLKSEAWIEQNRADKIDERIMAAVNASEMMELSTGVFVDMEDKDGEWKGEAYSAIARNYRPDHLALLPDKIGACSIKDGAGFLRNQAKDKGNPIWEKVQRALQLVGLASNELSFSNTSAALETLLRKRFNVAIDAGPGHWLWVTDVYSNFVVYEKDGKLFRLGYFNTDTGVSLSEDKPVEVKRVTEYRTVEGAFVGNRDHTEEIKIEDTTIMEKKKLVDAIVANTGWSEADREKLMALTEDQLKLVENAAKPLKPTTPAPAPAPVVITTPAPAVVVLPPPVANQTLDQYVQNAPKEIQDVLRNSLSVYGDEKQKLIDIVTANKYNTFTKEELSNRPLGELKSLARLAAGDPVIASRAVNYSGQAPTPVGNEVEECLEVPTLNYAKK